MINGGKKGLVISVIGFDNVCNPTYAHIRFFTKRLNKGMI